MLRPFRPSEATGRQALGPDPEIVQMSGGAPDFSQPVAMSEDGAMGGAPP